MKQKGRFSMQCKCINIRSDHLSMYCLELFTFINLCIVRVVFCMLSCSSLCLYHFSTPRSTNYMNVAVGVSLCDLYTVTSQPHPNSVIFFVLIFHHSCNDTFIVSQNMSTHSWWTLIAKGSKEKLKLLFMWVMSYHSLIIGIFSVWFKVLWRQPQYLITSGVWLTEQLCYQFIVTPLIFCLKGR